MSRRFVKIISTGALYFVIALGFHVLGGAVDQPHPQYAEGNWFTHRIGHSLWVAMGVAIAMLVLASLTIPSCCIVRLSPTEEPIFWPQFRKMRRWFSSRLPRLALESGLLLIGGYFAETMVEVWRDQHGAGWVCPPERVFISLMLGWGLLWIVDACSQLKYRSIVPAMVYELLMIWLLEPVAFGNLRE